MAIERAQRFILSATDCLRYLYLRNTISVYTRSDKIVIESVGYPIRHKPIVYLKILYRYSLVLYSIPKCNTSMSISQCTTEIEEYLLALLLVY
nr:MAG TPA: hypothetical protein [Bacteriophage sp.]